MVYVSFEIILQALANEGLDNVFEKLCDIFMREPLYVIDKCGDIVYSPIDEFDLWDYLENLENKINKEVLP